LQALNLFGIAWIETLAGKEDRTENYVVTLRELQASAPGRNFYLRERVARIVQAVRLSRGAKQGDWYRMTALDVLKSVREE
jgi:hypothetical protein